MIDRLVRHSPVSSAKADILFEDRVLCSERDADQPLCHRRPYFGGSSFAATHDVSDTEQCKGHRLAVRFCPRILLFSGAPTYVGLGYITK